MSRGRSAVALCAALIGVAACSWFAQDRLPEKFRTVPADPDADACRMIKAADCAYRIDSREDRAADFCPGLGTAVAPVKAFAHERDQKSNTYLDTGFAAEYPEFLVVAIRGTLPPGNGENPRAVALDWLKDMRGKLDPQGDVGRIHQGFRAAYRSLWPDIEGQLQAWTAAGALPRKPLYITGHSKGGAVAPMIALKATQMHYPVRGVFTFAAARPGGKDFHDNYRDGQLWDITRRFENRGDLVPHLPFTPRELLALRGSSEEDLRNEAIADQIDRANIDRYYSVGRLTYIDQAHRVIRPADEADEDDLDEARVRAFSPRQLKAVKDNHNIEAPPRDEKESAGLHRYFRTVCLPRN